MKVTRKTTDFVMAPFQHAVISSNITHQSATKMRFLGISNGKKA